MTTSPPIEERILFDEATWSEQLAFSRETLAVAVARLKFAEHYAQEENVQSECSAIDQQIARLERRKRMIQRAWVTGTKNRPVAQRRVQEADQAYRELVLAKLEHDASVDRDRAGRKGKLVHCPQCKDGTDASGNECPKCHGRKWLTERQANGPSQTDQLTRRFGLDKPEVLAALVAAGVDPQKFLQQFGVSK